MAEDLSKETLEPNEPAPDEPEIPEAPTAIEKDLEAASTNERLRIFKEFIDGNLPMVSSPTTNQRKNDERYERIDGDLITAQVLALIAALDVLRAAAMVDIQRFNIILRHGG